LKPGFQPLLVTGGFIEKMWAPTVHQLTEVVGVEVEHCTWSTRPTASTTTSRGVAGMIAAVVYLRWHG
jgi:hypothetical protein